MTQEEMIYKIIFPKDDDPNFINYGHFIGKNKMSLYKFKATVDESQLNPILIMDGQNENAFFVEVFQSELDGFLKLTSEFKFKQIKMSSSYMNEVKYMFKNHMLSFNSKNHRASMPMVTHNHLQLVNRWGNF